MTNYTVNNGSYSDEPDFRPYVSTFPVPDELDLISADAAAVVVESHVLEDRPHGFGYREGWIPDYDRFLTEEEKGKDPSKEDTGLFFFKGKPGEKVAVVNVGGGIMYTGYGTVSNQDAVAFWEEQCRYKLERKCTKNGKKIRPIYLTAAVLRCSMEAIRLERH